MQAKLTLRLDERLIAQAKARARRQGKSLSQLVADYFAQLDAGGERPAVSRHEPPLSPVVASLLGSLKGTGVPLEEDGRRAYRDHLEAKHR